MTNLNGIELVTADAPAQKLLASGIRIKVPGVTRFYDRQRKWPVIIADYERGAVAILWVDFDIHLRARLFRKSHGILFVARRFARVNYVPTARPEDLFQLGFVIGRCGRYQ